MKNFLSFLFILASVCSYGQQQNQSDGNKNFKVEATRTAQYIDGEKQLYQDVYNKIKYSDEAISKKVEAKILVSFIVETDSSVSNLRIMNDPGYGIGDSLKSFLQTSKFIPALMNGTPFKTQLMLNLPMRAH